MPSPEPEPPTATAGAGPVARATPAGAVGPRAADDGDDVRALDSVGAGPDRANADAAWAVGVLTTCGAREPECLPGRDRPYTDAEVRAVTVLYHRYAGRMLAAARRYFRHDNAAAAEAVHEAFALLPRRLQGYAAPDALEGFLVWGARMSARNLLLARVRRQEWADVSLDAPDTWNPAAGGSGGAPVTDADLRRLENRALVAQALAHLSDRERFVVLAFYYEGLSHDEIGRALGTTAGASNRLANTAKQKMRGWLEQNDVRSAGDALA